MTRIKDIAKQCNVSVSTVSKAFNGYHDISDETRNRILNAASSMGYTVKKALNDNNERTCNIGVLYEDASNQGLRNEHFAYIVASFKEKAAQQGYDITFIEHNIGNNRMSYLEHCRRRNFDGVCIACADFFDPEVVELVNSSFPVVTIDQVFNEAISILSDNMQGMRQLTEYIISRGHTKIAYIYGTKSSVTHNRLVGFHHAVTDNKITIPEEYIVEGMYRSVDRTEEITERLLDLSDPPTCIIAPDDYSALGVMNVARRRGLMIPEDISIAGYDGMPVSQVLEPKLTTIKQDSEMLGAEAARQLINLIENPMRTSLDTIMMKVVLVKGGSVSRINS